jgi:uroporphyrinogen decarboxylase
MGGISQDDALQHGSGERAVAELRRAWELTGGRRFLVGPGCSIPPATPAANLKAVRAAVDTVAHASSMGRVVAPQAPGPPPP